MAEAEEIGGRPRASELVRVLVVEEEDNGGPPGQAARCWTANTRLTAGSASTAGDGEHGGGGGRWWSGAGEMRQGGIREKCERLGILVWGKLTNGAPRSGAPLECFFV